MRGASSSWREASIHRSPCSLRAPSPLRSARVDRVRSSRTKKKKLKGTKKRTDVSKVDRRWRSDDGALASGRDFDPKRCASFFVRAVLRTIASWKLLPLFHLREAPSFPSDPDVSKEDERAMPLRKRSSSCPSHPALSRKKATSKQIHILSARFASLFCVPQLAHARRNGFQCPKKHRAERVPIREFE